MFSRTSEATYTSKDDEDFDELLNNDKNRKNYGWIVYRNNNFNIAWYNTGMKVLTFPSILDYLQRIGYVKF